MSWKRLLLSGCGLVVGLLMSVSANAAYPERTITLIVPFAPGGGTDITARIIAPYIEKYLGGKIIIENKPGAGGEIGTTDCMLAKPDGYTVCTFNVPNTLINPFHRKTRYSVDSFTPVANMVHDRSIIAVRSDSPFKSVKELFDYARANPKKVLFGASGIASNNHYEILKFQHETQTEFTIVQGESGAANRNHLLGGHVDVTATSITDLNQFIAEGKVRALCIHGADRMEQFPNIATCREQGYDWDDGSARGLVGPLKMPREAVTKLEAAIKKALEDPELQKQAEKASLPLKFIPSKEYGEYLQTNSKYIGELWKKYAK